MKKDYLSALPRRPWPAHKQKGQAMLEFVLVIPLLMLILFGLFDLGRVFFAAITTSNVAREGARYGSMHPNDTSDIKAAAVEEALNSGIVLSLADVEVTSTDLNLDGSADPGTPIRVTITYDVDLVMGWVLPSPITISRYVEMEIP